MIKRSFQLAMITSVALGLAVPAPAADVPYISGGIGGAEREELAAKERDYNVKIVTAMKSGEYLSGVVVVIESATKEPMLETTMAGPILLAKLPPGSYTIRATAGRATLTRTATTEAQSLKQVDLRWDDVR
jgi:hypothetical protein